jgi:hypothetical protein
MSTVRLLAKDTYPTYQTVPLSDGPLDEAKMDRFMSMFRRQKVDEEQYARLPGDERQETDDAHGSVEDTETPMSWLEYSIFALIGVAMLWAWCVIQPT